MSGKKKSSKEYTSMHEDAFELGDNLSKVTKPSIQFSCTKKSIHTVDVRHG
jgi:hypothetical protein